METKKTKGKGFIRLIRGIRSFFFEVLIVVIAVMFSFLLNEWRVERGEKQEEKEILAQVLEDLKADTAKIKFNDKQIKELAEVSLKLIQLTQDSIEDNFIKRYLEARSVITYVPFQASKAGYTELTTQGNANKIKNKQLLMHIMELYEGEYMQLIELNVAHKEFLINKLNSYTAKNFPHLSSRNDGTSKAKREKFVKAAFSDEFKHLLEFDYILKQNIIISHQQVLQAQDSLIKVITPLVD
jgi:hypothetical protein